MLAQAGEASQYVDARERIPKMKTLTVISILQIVAILLLFGKLANIEEIVGRSTPATVAVPLSSNPFQSAQNPVESTVYADESRLRQVIREELVAQLGQQAGFEARVNPAVTPGPGDSAEIERRREQVFQQLEYFSSVGRISDSEMAKLQMDIAKLDAAGRTAALAELSRALNSGSLEGRL